MLFIGVKCNFFVLFCQVGCLSDSLVYIRMKIRAAREVGIKVNHIQLPREVHNIISTFYQF